MRGKRSLAWLCMVLAGWLVLLGPAIAGQASGTDEAAIRQVLAAQEAAWNRGDINTFMRAYADSPDTTFIGSSVRKGYRTILEVYRKHYVGKAQMGTLTYSQIEVRPLPTAGAPLRYAVMTGRFHLERTEHGDAPKDDGVFSLLWEKTAEGWKIILDHTS